mmetsp:Transcript_22314/g.48541  ORF Transcript_22314/g.48541 Transcript_22314/m.48541 type:complete len:573 (-) Transcript_22314:9-1727(-)
MKKMKKNKQDIANYRSGNKELRNKLRDTRLKLARDRFASSPDDLDTIEKQVSMIRKNLDTVKSQVDKKREHLEGLRDAATELEMMTMKKDSFDSHFASTSPENAKRIRSLEGRLDHSIIKYNEAQSIRTTYEQIVKRLKEEKEGFDSQISAMEKTVAVKQKDLEELEILGGDAQHALNVVMKDLTKSREELDRERKARDKQLKSKNKEATGLQTMLHNIQNVDKTRKDILSEAQGDLSKDDEDRLRRMDVASTLAAQNKPRAHVDELKKIDEYENALTKIMKVAGVSDVNEIIKKIVSQSETTAELNRLISTNAEKIDNLSAKASLLKGRMEEVRYTGINRTSATTRKRCDELEDVLASARQTMFHERKRYEVAAATLLNARAGLKHLLEKMSVIQPQEKIILLNDDTLPIAAQQIEDTLMMILSTIKKSPKGTETANISSEEPENEPLEGVEEVNMLSARPYNQRVRLPEDDKKESKQVHKVGNETPDDDNNSELSEEEEGDVDPNGFKSSDPISRDYIKQASKIIVRNRNQKENANTKRARRANSVASSGRKNTRRPTHARGRIQANPHA